jgi:hypothetical protein
MLSAIVSLGLCSSATAVNGTFYVSAGSATMKGYCSAAACTPPIALGTIDHDDLSDGKTVEFLIDIGGVALALRVSGFLSDPGQSYISEMYLTCDSEPYTHYAASASYSYNSANGSAQWIWPRQADCMLYPNTYEVWISD